MIVYVSNISLGTVGNLDGILDDVKLCVDRSPAEDVDVDPAIHVFEAIFNIDKSCLSDLNFL